jgi:hypothetical protein
MKPAEQVKPGKSARGAPTQKGKEKDKENIRFFNNYNSEAYKNVKEKFIQNKRKNASVLM